MLKKPWPKSCKSISKFIKYFKKLNIFKKFISLLIIALSVTISLNLQLRAAGDTICVTIVANDCAGSSDTSGSGAVEWTDGNSTNNSTFGTFSADKVGSGNTYVNIESITGENGIIPRVGSKMVKLTKAGPYLHRSELSDISFNHPVKDPASGQRFNYWYSASYYIPDVQNWNITEDWSQFLGQFRYQNTLGCFNTQTPDLRYLGGSGAHFQISNGRLELDTVPNSDEGPNKGTDNLKHDLGPAIKGKWFDIIFQVKWSAFNDGQLRVWINENGTGGNYKLVLERLNTPNWIDKYNVTASCPFSGQDVPAPNWQVGLYAGGISTPIDKGLILYVDELREYRTVINDTVGSEAWNKVIR
jgi:Polysaccharide lyase